MSFYRTEKGFEVDVIVEACGKVMPIKIKSSMTYGRSLIHNLEAYCRSDPAAVSPILLYDGDAMKCLGEQCVAAKNWREAALMPEP